MRQDTAGYEIESEIGHSIDSAGVILTILAKSPRVRRSKARLECRSLTDDNMVEQSDLIRSVENRKEDDDEEEDDDDEEDKDEEDQEEGEEEEEEEEEEKDEEE